MDDLVWVTNKHTGASYAAMPAEVEASNGDLTVVKGESAYDRNGRPRKAEPAESAPKKETAK